MQPGSPQDLPDSKLGGAEELMLFVFPFFWTCLKRFGKPAVQQRSAARADNVGKDAAALQPCWPQNKDHQGLSGTQGRRPSATVSTHGWTCSAVMSDGAGLPEMA